MQAPHVEGWMLVVMMILVIVTVIVNFGSSIQDDEEQLDGVRNPMTQILIKYTGLPVISTEVVMLLVAFVLWLN